MSVNEKKWLVMHMHVHFFCWAGCCIKAPL